MNQFIINIIGGVIIAILVSWLGFGGSKVTIQHTGTSRKTGKKIMLFAILMIFTGAIWAGKDTLHTGLSNHGTLLASYGFILFIIGWVVNWFQKN